MKIIRVVLVLMITLSCSVQEQPSNNTPSDDSDNPIDESSDDSSADFHFLFIGNSLTSTNNLPQIIKNKYSEIGISISITSETPPGFGLEDHWNSGIIQGLIQSGYYDYVIIQQGPSSQEYGRWSLFEYGGRIRELCDASDTKLAFFMVWPSLSYYETFDGVITNYTDAASLNNAILCPVGRIWKYHFDQTDDLSYYSSDGFHPSLQGSEVAAQVIIQYLGI